MFKFFIDNASTILQAFGGLEMILGWAGHRWQWIKWSAFADFMMIMGAVLLAAGIWVGFEEKTDWELTEDQSQNLGDVLQSQPQKFEVWFYPLGRGSGSSADRYAAAIFKVFLDSKWSVKMPQSNWVQPDTTGMRIVVCDNPTSSTAIDAVILDGLFREAGLKLHNAGGEQDLNKRNCAVGIVVGRFPSLYERLNAWLVANT